VHASLRTVFTTTAVITAGVVLATVVTLPPATLDFGTALPSDAVMGAYHVHSSRSDGTGNLDAIAEAASNAGLSFVVFTDHSDATRAPAPPEYRHGVLCIDAVEVNTASGHIVALGLKGASPYPLAGPARDVLEDIHRMGGTAVMAHPDSPSPALRWRGPSPQTLDGIEWLNVDSEWRDDSVLTLLGTAAHGLIRGPAAVASLFSRPTRTLGRWDAEAARHPMFGLASLDAHASIPWRSQQEPRPPSAIPFPGYETLFRTIAQVVLLDGPLAGDPIRDTTRVLSAIEAGKSYSVVRAFAEPALLEFVADQGGTLVGMGGRMPAGSGIRMRASVTDVPVARVVLLRQGRPIAQGTGSVRLDDAVPGPYRVEVTLPGREMPWMTSNPIVLTDGQESPVVVPAAETEGRATVPMSVDAAHWRIEREASSTGSVTQDGRALQFSFSLGPGTPQGQYAAIASPVAPELGVERIRLTARAARPMRVSVQVRTPDALGGQRWRHSVYLDTNERTADLALEDFQPADAPTTRRPVVAQVQSLLFVVDTLNTLPGSAGTVWITDLALTTRTATSGP